jgi:Zn-dependent M28 family amino/carboxypeptidase
MIDRRAAAAAVLVTALLAGCSSSQPQQPNVFTSHELGRELAGKVTIDAVLGHLRKLQDIANANNGSRADGTPGYQASVEYVAQLLRDKGFDVQMPEVHRLSLVQQGNQTLTVAGRGFSIEQASLLLQTPSGGVSAPVVRPANAAGCAAADYASVPARGAIAVADDNVCSVVDKQNAAVANGAVALLVVNTHGNSGSPRGLFPSGYYDKLSVPTGVIGIDADAALRRTQAAVRLALDSKTVKITTRSVLGQTKSGDSHNVVMVGAHLDSTVDAPGIDNNGSGVAAVLETAMQLGSAPAVANAVRFAFWAAEEPGLIGSTDYVAGLDRDAINDIALYMNFDVLGSPNAGYFTDDGDQSGQPNPDVPLSLIPEGSAGIERTLAGYLNIAGRRPADQQLSNASDYMPFLRAGVPIGGITTGTVGKKTDVQARLWGGTPGVAFDANYRTPRDTIDNVSRDALAITGPGVAYAVGTYAQSISGVNGVPTREQRHREPGRP